MAVRYSWEGLRVLLCFILGNYEDVYLPVVYISFSSQS